MKKEEKDTKASAPKKQQITMKVNEEALEYFREESERTTIPYQTLINMYLMECAKKRKRMTISWEVPDDEEK